MKGFKYKKIQMYNHKLKIYDKFWDDSGEYLIYHCLHVNKNYHNLHICKR